MILLVARAYTKLILFEIVSALGGFPRVRQLVLRARRSRRTPDAETIQKVVDAVDIAACFYVRRVRCLHRSFATVLLMRKNGVDAELIIATRPLPFLSHAWVEVNGEIVNDRKGYQRKLIVLERI
jgi:hypothetical protein